MSRLGVMHILRGLYGWLTRSERRRLYHPDFTDTRFFAELDLASRGNERLARACRAFNGGDRKNAMAYVVEHFRRRDRPRFFIELDEFSSLLVRIEHDHPEWKRRTIEQAALECREGLAVFGGKPSQLRTAEIWTLPAAGPGHDSLYRVRPHFFEFAPRMALAAAWGAPEGALLGQLLETWMRVAAGGESRLPYFSDLTVGLRALSLSLAWAFLAGSGGDAAAELECLEFDALKVLRADGEFLERVVDEATPNNHKLTAGFVLWYVATIFPELAGGRPWRERGRGVLLEELERQLLLDGGGFEHALSYHLTVCEAASAFLLLGRRNGEDIPDWLPERVRRALEFQITVGGAQPRPLGDSSDYSLFPLHPWTWTTAAARELGRSIFGLPYPCAPPGDPGVEQAFWLLGGALARPREEPGPAFGLQSYPDSGYHVFTSQEPGTDVLFRTGPAPGRPLFAGHMHADLLSVYVRSRGNPIVVEAGTYTYRTAAGAWRRYFAGPESHNGLIVEGHGPLGTATGDFRPRDVPIRVVSRTAASSLVAWAEGLVQGSTIYAGCRRGVIALGLGFWVVYDLVAEHVNLADVSFAFQLEPGVRVSDGPGRALRVEAQDEELWMVPSQGLRGFSVHAGEVDPIRGWVSSRYGELVSAPQVRFRSAGTDRGTAFILADGRIGPLCRSVRVVCVAGGTTTIEIGWSDCTDRIVVGGGDGPARAFDGEFDGTLLWLRSRESEVVALRWLDGRSVLVPALSLDVRTERPIASLGLEMTPAGLQLTGNADGVTIVSGPDPSSARTS